jgi:septum formation protein
VRPRSSSPSLADTPAPLVWNPAWRLVLASASPQRSEILSELGIQFEARPTAAVELSSGDPAEVALTNAVIKAESGRAALSESERAECVVLAADTVVALGEKIYGKPASAEQAREYLTELASGAHEVIGGIALIDVDGVLRTAVARTEVEFKPLRSGQIEAQVALGEWQDRAGGYAIQLSGDEMVARIGDDRLNVVGLSVAALGGLVQGLLPNGSAAPNRYTD